MEERSVDLEQFSKLTNLDDLKLEVPSFNLKALNGKTKLSKLDLNMRKEEYEDLSILSQLTNLVDLSLNACILEKKPSTSNNVRRTPVGTRLSFSYKYSEDNNEKMNVDFSPLTSLVNLNHFHSHRTNGKDMTMNVVSIAPFSSLTKLMALSFYNINFNESPLVFKDFTNIKELSFHTCTDGFWNVAPSTLTDLQTLSQTLPETTIKFNDLRFKKGEQIEEDE
ncbi:MAG: hypothetical protein K2X98_06135 [Alphaproteobacteria bacterium]|nr:hypothetical protein [Alphaproteobacteria bacterium]